MLDSAVEQRILLSLNHEEGDRVPIWDYIDNRAIVDHLCPGETDYTKAMVRVYHHLGIDLCRGWGASYSLSTDGTELDGRRITGRSSWATRYPIQSLEDLRAFQPSPPDPARVREEWIPQQLRMKDLLEPCCMWVPGCGCGFHDAYGLMGQTLFSYAIYDAPSDVERIIEAMSERAACVAKIASETQIGPIFFIGDDVAYKGALLFSPEFLRRTFIKALKRCCEPLKNAGYKVIFHSDGYIMEILDDMIDAGIDGLNPIEPIAGMDIGFLKKRYGRNLVLVGNVDCSQVLPLGSVEGVVEATRECIQLASPGGGHFVGSSSEIVPSTPVENIVAFYDACRTYGRYPIAIQAG